MYSHWFPIWSNGNDVCRRVCACIDGLQAPPFLISGLDRKWLLYTFSTQIINAFYLLPVKCVRQLCVLFIEGVSQLKWTGECMAFPGESIFNAPVWKRLLTLSRVISRVSHSVMLFADCDLYGWIVLGMYGRSEEPTFRQHCQWKLGRQASLWKVSLIAKACLLKALVFWFTGFALFR